MDIIKKFVVFELNNVMGSERHKALELVEFKGFVSNSFDTEEDAIEALVKDKKTFEGYLIIRQIYID